MGDLTKKEQNRVSSVLTQSRLGIFDTEDKLTSDDNKNNVCASMNRCTENVKKVLSVFLCGSNEDANMRKLFNNIDVNGVSNIAEICGQLEDDPKVLERISIRTVFGGTEHMPFRGILYLLPVLNMCEQIKKTTSNKISLPNIEFLFMNGAGIVTNAIDPERAHQTTSQFIEIAKKYIEEYHPSLSENVNFYVDRTYTTSIIQTPEYNQIYRELENKLSGESEIKADLIEMGERRKAAQNSIKYATLHSFVQDGNIDSSIAKMSNYFGGIDQNDSDIIISIGAKPEEKFFKARKLLASKISEVDFFTLKKTAQYIANINVPPYSPLKTGELYLDDVIKDPTLIESARKRNRKDEYSEYQIPVQKAVENIIDDTLNSESKKDIIAFIEGINKEKEQAVLLDNQI